MDLQKKIQEKHKELTAESLITRLEKGAPYVYSNKELADAWLKAQKVLSAWGFNDIQPIMRENYIEIQNLQISWELGSAKYSVNLDCDIRKSSKRIPTVIQEGILQKMPLPEKAVFDSLKDEMRFFIFHRDEEINGKLQRKYYIQGEKEITDKYSIYIEFSFI